MNDNERKDLDQAVNSIIERCNISEKDRHFIKIIFTGAYITGKENAKEEILKTISNISV